jgi:hypothetical protein
MRYCFRHGMAQEEIDDLVKGCNELDDAMTAELLQFSSESAGMATPKSRQPRSRQGSRQPA